MPKRCRDHGGRTNASLDCPDCMADLDEELAASESVESNVLSWGPAPQWAKDAKEDDVYREPQ